MIAPTAVASPPVIAVPVAAVAAPPARDGAASAFDELVQEFAGGAAPVVPQMPGFAQAVQAAASPRGAMAKTPAFTITIDSFKAPAADRFKAPAAKPAVVAGKTSAPVFRAPSQPMASLQPALSAAVPAKPIPVQPAASEPIPVPAAPVVSEPEVETSKAVSAKAEQEASPETPQVAIPVVAGPARRTAGTPTQPVRSGSGASVAIPVIAIAIPVLPPLPVLSTKAAPIQTSAGSGEGGGSKPSVSQTEDPKTPERLSTNDVALQVNIKMASDANTVSAAGPDPLPLKQTLRTIAETPVVPVPVSATGMAAVAPATIAPNHGGPAVQTRPPEDAPPPRSTVPEEPAAKEPAAATPLKSLSLEFSPDGAGDVRLRVTERAGEVHISLHSSDTSLGGKLHEGVQDLVGNLSKAGYDAEAWTPGQGHQGNEQQQEQRRQPPKSGEAGTEEFGNIYEQQPGQEIS